MHLVGCYHQKQYYQQMKKVVEMKRVIWKILEKILRVCYQTKKFLQRLVKMLKIGLDVAK